MEIDPEVDGWSSTSALSWKEVPEYMRQKSRNNQQIWRMAEWLYNTCYSNGPYAKQTWASLTHPNHVQAANEWYDKALELLKKIDNREFVGPDNHKD